MDGAEDGRLVENIVHFGRALRKAGLRVGTAQVETAVRAVEAAGFSRRTDFYHTLRATMVTRAEDLETFHQVFAMFWRDPDFLQTMMHLLSPQLRQDARQPKDDAARRRAEDALARDRPPPEAPRKQEERVEAALVNWSGMEVLRRMDFEQMSAAELAEAERAVATLALPVKPIRTRRGQRSRRGAPDARATMRAALRKAGEVDRIARRTPAVRPPDLVALCDISGSMSVYSRVVLRFLHALSHARERGWGRVHAFTFGTALTNVTRALDRADPDAALAAIGREARDWEGGTRIGTALERFNKDWSRRVLGRGAVVLLITDGLERGDAALLAQEAERLHLSARALVWLNPLLRFDGFAPEAGGIRALLPHVDSFHACHSLDSLADLSRALGASGERDRLLRAMQTR
ncbi:vWA domain-containing protein [Tranquillimonas alkanivorans]|uniref:VWFA domain-containing protein n=1 Tax=Tranquillimonas alkanivorans TaxID=441119 RepID=A0A1I5NQ94_9RHOB|nr:VWA domain-containing protein [Tranquillimonas alkanivorans]SFP23401.1 hypothetical protein SAMN04488047_10411 [Tranquillimonas alkanivorans]